MVEPDQGQESENDQRETLRRLSLVELLSVIFNAVLAVTAIAGSCFLYRQTNATEEQLKAMRGQLAEMKGGSADTHNLAVATGSYAADMKRLAEQTKSLAEAARKSATAAEKSEAATEKLAHATSDAAAASHSLAESAGQSTAATQRLASAANDANTVSRELVKATQQSNEMTINSQRAFVLVKGAAVEYVSMDDLIRRFDLFSLRSDGPKNDPKKDELLKHLEPLWLINLIWENSGNTSTKDLTISTTFWNDTKNIAKHPFDISAIPKDDNLVVLDDTKLLLGPKQSAPVMSGGVGTLGMAAWAIFGGFFGQPHFYTFGTAKYRDILNPAYVHRTDFCYRVELTGDFKQGLIPTKSQTKTEPPAASLTPCETHNCTDEGCEPHPAAPPEPAKPPAKPPV